MSTKKIWDLVETAVPEGTDRSDIDIWFQDESRIGQQGSINRIWHSKGQRPRLIRQQQFEYAYIDDAICPSRGESVGLALPVADTQGMRLHLEEISKVVPTGRHAVVVMDGTGWHQPSLNLWNVSILKLPAYSPELNPVEQVWQWLKSRYLSNRCYQGYDQIIDAICHAWCCFAEQPELIKSIGNRDWAISWVY